MGDAGVTGGIADGEARRAAATQLRAGARAFAAGAVEALIERGTEGPGAFGAAFATWHAFLTQRVQELATAVEFDEPVLFARQLWWLRSTLDARELDPGDFDASIGCLNATVVEDLPGEAGRVTEETLRAAVDLSVKEDDARTPERARVDCADEHDAVAALFLERALNGRPAEAVETAVSAVGEGMPPSAVLERVLLSAQAELGVMWELGEIGVFEEHAATNAVHAAMAVVWHSARSGDVKGTPVIVGSTSGDQHDIGGRVTSYVIDLAGRAAVCLGADLPSDEFVLAGRAYGSGDFVLSATLVHQLPRVREAVGLIRRNIADARVVLGGPVLRGDEAFIGRMAVKLGADAIVNEPSGAAAVFAGS